MKKILSMFLVMILLLSISSALSEVKKNNEYRYEIKGKNVTILNYLGSETGKLVIPDTIEDKKVTIIATNAFLQVNAEIVVLPQHIQKIESYAFDIQNCKEIIFPETDNKITINHWAFQRCSKLEKINFPVNVVFAGNSSPFYGAQNLKSITINEKSKQYEIYENALISKKDKKLILYPIALMTGDTLIIPDGIKIIGDLFIEVICDSVIIPDSVVSIDSGAFIASSMKHLEIGAGVKKMGNQVFYDCDDLKTVKIKDGAALIGRNAFRGCKSLESIIIPTSVKKIDKSAFGNNINIKIIADSKSAAAKFARTNGYELVEPDK